MNKQQIIDKLRRLVGQATEETRALSIPLLFDQVYAMVEQVNPGGYPWIHDLFYSEEGMSVIWSDGGILYGAPVNIDADDIASLGEVSQVKQEFVPVGRTVLRQQDDGQWRWFSRSAVSVLNRVGEIDSTALFDSFIEHAHETDEWPTRQFFHEMSSKFTTGQCDWIARDGNVLLSSGLYNDSKLAALEIEARQREPDEWGDSIHFEPLGDDALETLRINGVEIPVYQNGRLIEISTVPEKKAASWFTSGTVDRSRVMEKETFDGLIKLCGDDEEKAKEIAGFLGVDELNRQIQDAGLVARSTEDDETPDDGALAPIVIDDGVIRQVVDVALKSEVFTVQREAVEEQDGKLDALTVKLDELTALVTAQQAAIDLLAADDDEKRQIYREDLPPQRQQVIYKPSVVHREQGENGNQLQPTAAEKAQSTLAAKGIGG